MDETLYQMNNNFDYNNLKRNDELILLIKKLNGTKILFTNASHHHTNIVLQKLGLVSSFDLILDRNILKGLKPSPEVFFKLIKWCSITQNDTCYFFEDSIQNLIVGSSLGWKTILIIPQSDNSTNKVINLNFMNNGKIVERKAVINYSFKNINEALRYFVNEKK
jgi:HAD superfamily hydrolase (TIGR01509 family)